jgi:hypothetical protein
MPSIQTLVDELTNDPLGRNYTPMTNIQVADSLNTADIQRDLSSLDTNTIMEAIDETELNALTDRQIMELQLVAAQDSVDPFGWAADWLIRIFGAGSATITALAPLRRETVSRAEQLGYGGIVKEGHVEMARAKMGG